jgi:folate-binding protein YgfZ
MKYAQLPYRLLVISKGGPAFVDGLASNTSTAKETAFLDINGKIIATCWQQVKADNLFLYYPEMARDSLLKHIRKYQIVSPVGVEERAEKVWLVNGATGAEAEVHLPGYSVFAGQPVAQWDEFTEEALRAFRIQHNIPLQGIDFKDNMVMEINKPELISFNKGCYLGQEIVARVASRGTAAKTLERVIISGRPEDTLAAEQLANLTTVAPGPEPDQYLAFYWLKKNNALPPGMTHLKTD